MKITKTILALATAQAHIDIKTSNHWEDKDLAKLTDWNAEHLNDIKKALLTERYYTRVEAVSKSGMSRTIAIAFIENNRLRHAQDWVYKLAGCDSNRRISGCGMDMLFAAQYNLFAKLCRKMPYQTKMKRYNSL